MLQSLLGDWGSKRNRKGTSPIIRWKRGSEKGGVLYDHMSCNSKHTHCIFLTIKTDQWLSWLRKNKCKKTNIIQSSYQWTNAVIGGKELNRVEAQLHSARVIPQQQWSLFSFPPQNFHLLLFLSSAVNWGIVIEMFVPVCLILVILPHPYIPTVTIKQRLKKTGTPGVDFKTSDPSQCPAQI